MDIIEKLKEYDFLYYNVGDSGVSDEEYDALKEMARGMFPNHEYFSTVGASVPSEYGKKIKFNYVIGSLRKTKPIDGTFQKWLGKFKPDQQFVVMPKLDGASIVAEFVKGNLLYASTRGDAREGVNITDKLQHLPQMVSSEFTGLLRGEIILFGDAYKTLSRDNNKIGFANRRNAVIGILNNENNTNSDQLQVIFYEVIESNTSFNQTETTGLRNRVLKQFSIPEYVFSYDKMSNENLISVLKTLKEHAQFDMDGLVVMPLGYIHNRENVEFPENKVAFKVNEEPSLAIVDKIEWNVTKTGKVVPVVIFEEPTLLSGAMVSRAHGFNYKFIKENNVGNGTVVAVVRSGEVIPHIEKVVSSTVAEIPNVCPSCGSELFQSETGVDLYCKNNDCSSSSISKIVYWLEVLGAENIGEAVLENLKIYSLERLYSITWDEIAQTEGFGEKSADNFMYELNKTLNPTVEQFVIACGIPLIAESNVKKIFRYLKSQTFVKEFNEIKENIISEEKIFKMFCEYNATEYLRIPGFGEKLAKSINDNRERIANIYTQMSKVGLKFKENNGSVGSKLAGKRIALTGDGPISRKELEKKIEEQGGTNGGMSKDTDILVCNDVNSGSSKLQKATKYGTKIISYEDFIKNYI